VNPRKETIKYLVFSGNQLLKSQRYASFFFYEGQYFDMLIWGLRDEEIFYITQLNESCEDDICAKRNGDIQWLLYHII
jgi:hypothetical protein